MVSGRERQPATGNGEQDKADGQGKIPYLKKVYTTPVEGKRAAGSFSVFPGLCKGCGLCIEKCPVDAIDWSDKLGVYGTPTVRVLPDRCIVCRTCETVCPDAAIAVEKKKKEAPASR